MASIPDESSGKPPAEVLKRRIYVRKGFEYFLNMLLIRRFRYSVKELEFTLLQEME